MGTTLKTIIEHWQYLAPIVKRPENEKDYKALVSHLDTLLHLVGDNDRHPLTGLVDTSVTTSAPTKPSTTSRPW